MAYGLIVRCGLRYAWPSSHRPTAHSLYSTSYGPQVSTLRYTTAQQAGPILRPTANKIDTTARVTVGMAWPAAWAIVAYGHLQQLCSLRSLTNGAAATAANLTLHARVWSRYKGLGPRV